MEKGGGGWGSVDVKAGGEKGGHSAPADTSVSRRDAWEERAWEGRAWDTHPWGDQGWEAEAWTEEGWDEYHEAGEFYWSGAGEPSPHHNPHRETPLTPPSSIETSARDASASQAERLPSYRDVMDGR